MTQQNGLVAARHRAMHHWAIPIALDVNIEALMWFAPLDIEHCSIEFCPRKAPEPLHGAHSRLVVDEIHVAEAKQRELSKVCGRI